MTNLILLLQLYFATHGCTRRRRLNCFCVKPPHKVSYHLQAIGVIIRHVFVLVRIVHEAHIHELEYAAPGGLHNLCSETIKAQPTLQLVQEKIIEGPTNTMKRTYSTAMKNETGEVQGTEKIVFPPTNTMKRIDSTAIKNETGEVQGTDLGEQQSSSSVDGPFCERARRRQRREVYDF